MSKDVARIRALEKEISTNPKSANKILALKEKLVGGRNEVRLASLHSLRRIFVSFMDTGKLTIVKQNDPDATSLNEFKQWLQLQLQSYQECLCESIKTGDTVMMAPAIRTMVELVRREWLVRQDCMDSKEVQKARFGVRGYTMLMNSLLYSDVDLDIDVLLVMRSDVFSRPDCAYYAFVLIKRALKDAKKALKSSPDSADKKKAGQAALFRNALDLLRVIELPVEGGEEEPLVDLQQNLRMHSQSGDTDSSNDDMSSDDGEESDRATPTESDSDSDSEDLRKVVGKARAKPPPIVNNRVHLGKLRASADALKPKAQKKVFSEAWLSLLALPLTNTQHKLVLKHLPEHVMPNLNNPLLLADFLYRSYSKGGVIAVLALQSLFNLIVQHNLDYPDFFISLYDLCTTEVFQAKYREQFLPLLHASLKSVNIPAYIVASFVKRLMQLALLVPAPCGAFCIMQATWLLRKHQECQSLLHQEKEHQEKGQSAITGKRKRDDTSIASVYSVKKPSKLEDGADLNSSLWEATGLQHHYLHSTATFSKALESPRSTSTGVDAPYINVPDYIDHNYDQLFDMELSRLKSDGCPTAFEKPAALITKEETLGVILGV